MYDGNTMVEMKNRGLLCGLRGNLAETENSIKKDAVADFFRTRMQIKKAKCRRSVPSWCLPNEMWRLLLCTPLPEVEQRRGIDSSACYESMRPMHEIICQILVKIRVDRKAPMQRHHSKVFSLPKKNPANVSVMYGAQKAVHTLDSLGKAYYKQIMNECKIDPAKHYEYG